MNAPLHRSTAAPNIDSEAGWIKMAGLVSVQDQKAVTPGHNGQGHPYEVANNWTQGTNGLRTNASIIIKM